MSILYFRFSAHRPDDLQRAPSLERLVARATTCSPVVDWRADAFRVIAPQADSMPALVAPAARAARGEFSGAWICIATPVHLDAGMSTVSMGEDGILELSPEEARALSKDFQAAFAGSGIALSASAAGILLCVFDRPMDVVTHDPQALVGQDVFRFQSAGADAALLRRIMTELEMWLFDHAVNQARAACGKPIITGLWLWGGGALQATELTTAALDAVHGWTAGRDPFFAPFGAVGEFPRGSLPGVVVSREHPGSSRWPAVEAQWLEPAMEGVRSGRIKRIELSAGARSFAVGRGPHWRFWRRPRPWWESFDRQG